MANVSGPFDLIQPFMGGDASEPIKRYLDEQARANAEAVAGNPNARFSGTYATPPDGSAPKAPPMGKAPPGPQEPQALQTPKSWGSMLMDLQRQNEAAEGFNSAVGMGLSAFSQPRNRENVSKMFNHQAPDVMKMGEQLQNMSSAQQGQDRANMVARIVNDPKTGQPLAQKLNMPYETLKAGIIADPGLVAKVAEAAAAPTPTMAEVQQATTWMQSQGWDPKKIKDTQELIMTGVVKSEDLKQMEIDRQAYKAKHGVDPPWAGSPTAWKQDIANTQELNASVNKARETHATVLPTLTDMKNRIASIKQNPNLDKLLSDPVKRQQAQLLLNADPTTPWATVLKLLPAGSKSLSQEELNLVSDIRQLNGQEYGAALQTLHQTRPAASEVAAMKTGIGQTQALELDPKAYRDQALDSLDDYIKTEIATSYGASQNFKDMPEEYRPYVNPQFVKGGSRHLEDSGSDDWADKVKPGAEEIETARKAIVSGKKTRAQVDRWMRAHGMRAEGY